MKHLQATPILMIIVLFLSAAPAFGQIAKDGELSPFFGVTGYSKNRFQIGSPQASPPIDSRLEFKNEFRYGLRFNVANHGHWGEEFFYSYEHNHAKYFVGVANLDLPIQIHNLGVTGLFYFNDDEQARTRPFLKFGLGATIYKPTKEAKTIAADPTLGGLPGFGQSNEISFHYGAGFKHRFNKAVGFRMDASHSIGRTPSFSLSRRSDNPNELVFPTDGAIHNVEASIGLVFYFGR